LAPHILETRAATPIVAGKLKTGNLHRRRAGGRFGRSDEGKARGAGNSRSGTLRTHPSRSKMLRPQLFRSGTPRARWA